MVKKSLSNANSYIKQFEKYSDKQELEVIAFSNHLLEECTKKTEQHDFRDLQNNNSNSTSDFKNESMLVETLCQHFLSELEAIGNEMAANMACIQTHLQSVDKENGKDLLNVLEQLSKETSTAQKVLEYNGPETQSQLMQGLLMCMESD
ncbi:meiotic recombination protein Rec25 [Schizosaccharomyces cryophilus OY26]|uniref:Meiotic recombination protein Rec25 n=1 Tax=Schizosaccharomyces cryophilus (strain OY26 / ATCC MYA-4695 / CBS 11777 / NBRC 106824 / NRRL Y48691) TaxID=653667 RepID=S9W0R5_SCHCR|nr:meiotic recombination protein Rec25 [Schizosaccharomyces cryophilus OY26]EPY53448.1 meiotic recombination protein Rec25 [Schizosaccharomyces cryophilus OY26]